MTKAEKLTQKYGKEFETLIHAVVKDSDLMMCSNCWFYYRNIEGCGYNPKDNKRSNLLIRREHPNHYCDNFKMK